MSKNLACYLQPLKEMNQRLTKDKLQRIFFNIYKYLRVMLAKMPDMSLPTFFDIIPVYWHSKKYLSSRYMCLAPKCKIWGLFRAMGRKSSFESKAKISQSGPTFFNYLHICFQMDYHKLSKILKVWNNLFPFPQNIAILDFNMAKND